MAIGDENDDPKDDIDLGEIFNWGKKTTKKDNETAYQKNGKIEYEKETYYNTEADTYYKLKNHTNIMIGHGVDKKHITKALETITKELKHKA